MTRPIPVMRGQWAYVEVENGLGLHDTHGIGQIGLQDMYNPAYAGGSEYQRQQLNLMRRHQGLPPIAPAYRGGDWLWEGLMIGVRAFVSIYVVWIGATFLLNSVVAIPIAIAYFVFMTHRRNEKHRRTYRRQLQHWINAGCP